MENKPRITVGQWIFFILVGLYLLIRFIIFLASVTPPNNMSDNMSTTDNISQERAVTEKNIRSGQQHFTHKTITYSFMENDDSTSKIKFCAQRNINKMKEAFEIVSNKTNLVFIEVNNISYPDIKIYCGDTEFDPFYSFDSSGQFNPDKVKLITGEAYTDTNYNMEIIDAKIYLYGNPTCINFPDTELHELLHIFGYQHSNNSTSIMYDKFKNCYKKEIDPWIIKDLNSIYK